MTHLIKYCANEGKPSEAAKEKYEKENKEYAEKVSAHLANLKNGKSMPSHGAQEPKINEHDLLARCCIEVNKVFDSEKAKSNIKIYLEELAAKHKQELEAKKAKHAAGNLPSGSNMKPPPLLSCIPVECTNDQKCHAKQNIIKKTLKTIVDKVKKGFAKHKKSVKNADED